MKELIRKVFDDLNREMEAAGHHRYKVGTMCNEEDETD